MISMKGLKDDSKVWKKLLSIFNSLLQLRNSWTEKEIDEIRCPSCRYCTNSTTNGNKNILRNVIELKDADANGAYNIARKGILMLQKLEKDETEKPKLYISDSEWDEYTLS